MAIGHDGYVYFGDNVHLDITRADGNDNDEDEPELPDDPEITQPDVYADTYDNTWDDTATIVTEQNINTAFSDFIWKNFTSTEGSNELTGSNVSGSGAAIGQTISGFGLPSGTVTRFKDVDGNTIEVSNDATQTNQNPPGFASYTFQVTIILIPFFGEQNILTQLI